MKSRRDIDDQKKLHNMTKVSHLAGVMKFDNSQEKKEDFNRLSKRIRYNSSMENGKEKALLFQLTRKMLYCW